MRAPTIIVLVLLLVGCFGQDSDGPGLIRGATGITAGSQSSCALDAAGEVSCWGALPPGVPADEYGRSSVAAHIPMPEGIIALSLAQATIDGGGCAVGTSLQTYCWGHFVVDIDAGIGFPAGISALPGAASASSVAFGGDHFCVTRTDAVVRCFGAHSGGGRGTDSVPLDSLFSAPLFTPNALSPAVAALATAQGTAFGCALRTDSLVSCWGLKLRGQLGGAAGDSAQACGGSAPPWCQPGPALIAGGHKYLQISANFDQVCAVRSSGAVECWGRKSGTVRGNWLYTGCPTASDCVMTPTAIPLPSSATQVAVGDDHACALLGTGAVYCWGSNEMGQLGRVGAASATPVAVEGGLSFASIAAGGDHTCGITTSEEEVVCWGSNWAGQLGDGTREDRDHPVSVLAAE